MTTIHHRATHVNYSKLQRVEKTTTEICPYTNNEKRTVAAWERSEDRTKKATAGGIDFDFLCTSRPGLVRVDHTAVASILDNPLPHSLLAAPIQLLYVLFMV